MILSHLHCLLECWITKKQNKKLSKCVSPVVQKDSDASSSEAGQQQEENAVAVPPQELASTTLLGDGTVQDPQVCVDFLNGTCSGQNGSCAKGQLHSLRPYQWQVRDDNAAVETWFNLP
jgi:hypothetical protein